MFGAIDRKEVYFLLISNPVYIISTKGADVKCTSGRKYSHDPWNVDVVLFGSIGVISFKGSRTLDALDGEEVCS